MQLLFAKIPRSQIVEHPGLAQVLELDEILGLLALPFDYYCITTCGYLDLVGNNSKE